MGHSSVFGEPIEKRGGSRRCEGCTGPIGGDTVLGGGSGASGGDTDADRPVEYGSAYMNLYRGKKMEW